MFEKIINQYLLDADLARSSVMTSQEKNEKFIKWEKNYRLRVLAEKLFLGVKRMDDLLISGIAKSRSFAARKN